MWQMLNLAFIGKTCYVCAFRAGIKVPTVEVRWQNLHVECNVVVGDRGLPTVMNSYRTFIEVCSTNYSYCKPTSIRSQCRKPIL